MRRLLMLEEARVPGENLHLYESKQATSIPFHIMT